MLGRKGSAAKRYPTTPSADYLLTSPEQDSAFSIRSLANPPFKYSDTALRDSAFLKCEAKPKVVSEAKGNFRKDDDVRLQWSAATWTTRQGCPQGERGTVHQFGFPPKGNGNLRSVNASNQKESSIEEGAKTHQN